jgi:hypothetical protein
LLDGFGLHTPLPSLNERDCVEPVTVSRRSLSRRCPERWSAIN